MKLVWQKQAIPTAWKRAGGILIPEEKDFVEINQFHHISHWNVEGKVFFSVLAHRLTKKNNYINHSVQKAGILSFTGCLEHVRVIWHQIQVAKKDYESSMSCFWISTMPLALSLTSVFGLHSAVSVFWNL